MSDRQHGAVGKLAAYRRLNQLISLNINGGRRLIKHKD